MYQPLADLLRPTNLDEVFGQEHILGKGAVLRRLIDSGNIPNMISHITSSLASQNINIENMASIMLEVMNA